MQNPPITDKEIIERLRENLKHSIQEKYKEIERMRGEVSAMESERAFLEAMIRQQTERNAE